MEKIDSCTKEVEDTNLLEHSNSSSTPNNDLAFDGMWSFVGYDGMMVKLAQDFVKSQQDELSIENDVDVDEHDCLDVGILDPSNSEAFIHCQEDLYKRDLHMAAGVLRRLVEGCCPPKLRIRRLDEDTTMTTLMEHKRKGNYYFGRYEFRAAMDCYDSALSSIPETQRDLYVAPRHQIQQIVNILSNKAECLLRKMKFEDAAETATEALIFMGDHEKSRIRRAKAGLEVGKYDRYEATCRGDGTMTGVAYLVQAKYDLDEVLNGPESSKEGRKTASEIMSQVEKLLNGARKKVLSKNPNEEWDLSVLKIQSRCW